MKKMTKVVALATLLSVAVLNGASVSQAAEVGSAGSKGSVDFRVSDTPLKFVDGGATDISFGQVEISGDSETYDAIYNDTKFTKFGGTEQFSPLKVSVKDDRGTMPGYKVKVAMTKQFTNDTAAVKTLVGATVELSSTDAFTNKELASRIAPTTFNTNVVVGEGVAAQEVFGAKTGEGSGTWAFFFGDLKDAPKPEATVKNDKVKLHLPGGASKENGKEYVADLTWSLEDTP